MLVSGEEKRKLLTAYCGGKHCSDCLIHHVYPTHPCGFGLSFIADKPSSRVPDEEVRKYYDLLLRESPVFGQILDAMRKEKELVENLKNDPVNPNHYKQGSVECIEGLKAATVNLKGIEAVCTANCIKYLWRWKEKNGLEDLKKAEWYLHRLMEEVNE